MKNKNNLGALPGCESSALVLLIGSDTLLGMVGIGLMTLDEASAYLGVAKISLRRWTTNGQLKCVRVGPRRDHRCRKSDLDGYMRKNLTRELTSRRTLLPTKRITKA